MAARGGRRRGDLVIFRRVVAPYDEARPVPAAAIVLASLDGTPLPAAASDPDPGTAWTSPVGIVRGSGLSVRLDRARRLSAVVFGLDLERSPLAVPWICEADGAVVAAGTPLTAAMVNGAPRRAPGAAAVPLLGARGRGAPQFQAAGPS